MTLVESSHTLAATLDRREILACFTAAVARLLPSVEHEVDVWQHQDDGSFTRFAPDVDGPPGDDPGGAPPVGQLVPGVTAAQLRAFAQQLEQRGGIGAFGRGGAGGARGAAGAPLQRGARPGSRRGGRRSAGRAARGGVAGQFSIFDFRISNPRTRSAGVGGPRSGSRASGRSRWRRAGPGHRRGRARRA